jgi:hypothetical protein
LVSKRAVTSKDLAPGLVQRQVRVFVLAASDMNQAAAAARALASEENDHDLMRALETAMAVCYARPFRPPRSSGLGHLDPRKWAPDERMSWLHAELLALRNHTYAHTDEASGRDASTVDFDPDGEAAIWREEWNAFPREWLPDVITMCHGQAGRFGGAAAALLVRQS